MKINKILLGIITLSSTLGLRTNYIFASENDIANPSEDITSVSGILNLSDNGGFNPNPPSDLNKKTGINNSYLGIAYVPKTFDFGSTRLLDGVQKQVITTNRGDKTFNIGVKDKRRDDTQRWTLNVKHNINIDNGHKGITLTAPITRDIKRNMNDGTENFKNSDLIKQVKKYGIDEVKKVEENTVTITLEDNAVMYNEGGQFVNGVYDFELGNIKLTIPDSSKVPEQTITGNVEWTLSNTPMKTHYLTTKIRNLFKDGNCKELKTDITVEQLKAAKASINSIQNDEQKKYNQEHFNKYVESNFIEWYGYGVAYAGMGDIPVIKVNLLVNANRTEAKLRLVDNDNYYKPHGYWGGRDYMYITLKRGGNLIVNQHILGDDLSKYDISAEVKPGDILEIYHAEGANRRLQVYPQSYKQQGITQGSSITLKYRMTEDFHLEPIRN